MDHLALTRILPERRMYRRDDIISLVVAGLLLALALAMLFFAVAN
jgi:hypothetical protein